jgi:hypothetical protein
MQRLPDEQRESVAGRDFWRGHWHGHELAVLARVGKVAATTPPSWSSASASTASCSPASPAAWPRA